MYHGARGVIAREFDPTGVLDFFEQSGITKLFMVPAAMQFVVRQPRARTMDFSRLKYMLYGASPIPAALLEKLAVHPLSRDLYPTSLGHYRRARDHRMSRERHDEHLLIYCSEGQGLLRVREGEAWREYRV
ncbi:AMP-binding protein, partial [Stenotrophomonas maltophilia]|uniref:AMP-binding protein n=1 Tax=Stenotrophomonas maltophilia TaxID=40324 RepID=UPI0027D236A3